MSHIIWSRYCALCTVHLAKICDICEKWNQQTRQPFYAEVDDNNNNNNECWMFGIDMCNVAYAFMCSCMPGACVYVWHFVDGSMFHVLLYLSFIYNLYIFILFRIHCLCCVLCSSFDWHSARVLMQWMLMFRMSKCWNVEMKRKCFCGILRVLQRQR